MKKMKQEEILARFFAIELTKAFMAKKKLDYSNAFKTFNSSAVAIVRNLGPCILSKRHSHDQKMYYSQELLNQLSCVYGITPPYFFYKETKGETNGQYDSRDHSITMINKLSLVTLLHEFRHAMQHKGAKMIDQDKEEDARAWSMSLFKKALPKSHKRACEKNLVKYQ